MSQWRQGATSAFLTISGFSFVGEVLVQLATFPTIFITNTPYENTHITTRRILVFYECSAQLSHFLRLPRIPLAMSRPAQPELKSAFPLLTKSLMLLSPPYPLIRHHLIPAVALELILVPEFMDRRLYLHLQGGRELSGVLRGFDLFLNLVMDNAYEELGGGVRKPCGMVVSLFPSSLLGPRRSARYGWMLITVLIGDSGELGQRDGIVG